jgi:hypothetical protein
MSTIDVTDILGFDSNGALQHAQLAKVLPQRHDSLHLASLIDRQVLHLAQSGSFFLDSATCIDRGCGCSSNSDLLVSAFVGAVRKHSSVPIFAICNDLYPEMFTPLAQRLAASTLTSQNVTFQMSCNSFLRQVAPPQSVDMVMSNAVVHWLDAAHMKRAREDGNHLIGSIAAEQFSQLLRSAERELRMGGKMVLSFIAARDAWHREHHAPLVLLELAVQEEFDVSPRDYAKMGYPVPVYLRTEEEIRAPFASATCRLRLELCCLDSVACPYARLLHNGEAERYASAYTNFIRAFSEIPLRRWLEGLGLVRAQRAQSLEIKLASIYGNIHSRILHAPHDWVMQKCRATVIATRL